MMWENYQVFYWPGEVTYALGNPGDQYFGVTKEADGTGRIYTIEPVDRDTLSTAEMIFLIKAEDGKNFP